MEPKAEQGRLTPEQLLPPAALRSRRGGLRLQDQIYYQDGYDHIVGPLTKVELFKSPLIHPFPQFELLFDRMPGRLKLKGLERGEAVANAVINGIQIHSETYGSGPPKPAAQFEVAAGRTLAHVPRSHSLPLARLDISLRRMFKKEMYDR